MEILKLWLDFLFDIEKKHEGFMKLISYALRKNGGFLWPILYGFLYYYARNSLSNIGQDIFLVLGIPLVAIAYFYPKVWEHHHIRMQKDFSNIQHLHEELRKCLVTRGFLYEESESDYSEESLLRQATIYEKYWKKLSDSIEIFSKEYFLEGGNVKQNTSK